MRTLKIFSILILGQLFTLAYAQAMQLDDQVSICKSIHHDNRDQLLKGMSVVQMHQIHVTCEALGKGTIEQYNDIWSKMGGLSGMVYVQDKMTEVCRKENYREKYCDFVERGYF